MNLDQQTYKETQKTAKSILLQYSKNDNELLAF